MNDDTTPLETTPVPPAQPRRRFPARPILIGAASAVAVLGLGVGGLTTGWGPRGMWLGLIAGLLVAAVLLSLRFVRSSDPARLRLILNETGPDPAPDAARVTSDR